MTARTNWRWRRATTPRARRALALALAGALGGGCRQPAAEPAPGPAEKPAETAVEELAALAYLNFSPVAKADRGKVGVTLYRENRAERGYNLYPVTLEPEAVLVDMRGRVVHRWRSEVDQPTPDGARDLLESFVGWQHVAMLPNGDLLALVHHRSLLKLDWDSRLLWKVDLPVHHEIDVDETGAIYTLVGAPRRVSLGGHDRTILDDAVVVLSPDGDIERKHSLFDAFQADPELQRSLEATAQRKFRGMERISLARMLAKGGANRPSPADLDGEDHRTQLRRRMLSRLDDVAALLDRGTFDGEVRVAVSYLRGIPGAPADLFHANSVSPLPRSAAGFGERGDLLVSNRTGSHVFVLDRDTGRAIWSLGARQKLVSVQHMPRVVDRDAILVFDNGSLRRGAKYSRAVEIDPRTKAVVWEYKAEPPTSFFSGNSGSTQRLANGNTLIGATTQGRVFEVTPAGEVVWEYYLPFSRHDATRRTTAYRVTRVPAAQVDPQLARASARAGAP